MRPHIQQTETAQPAQAPQSADFATLETKAPSITGVYIANDNTTAHGRPNIVSKRRRRRARQNVR